MDGYTSSAILIMYLRKLDPSMKVKYYMHDSRENGLTKKIMARLLKDKPNVVILPDASSNDYKQHKELKELGIDVIALDHHESERESEDAIVVNPQLSPEYFNTDIAGVGVTYKFLQALDDYYKVSYADDNLDLVAIGNVTDSIAMSSPETRYLVYKGFENLRNPFFKALLAKNAGWSKEIYPQLISFDLAPKFNALIRVAKVEEKLDVFRAMLGEEEDYYNPRTKRTEKLHEKAVRLCTNAYGKQRTLRLKLVDQIKEKIEAENLNDNAFLVIQLDDFQKGLSGFIAGSLVNLYNKPVLIMSWNEDQQAYMGSLRGHEKTLGDTKAFLETLNLFNFIAGHGNAAGLSISKDNAAKLNQAINSKINFSMEDEVVEEVDFELHANNLTLDLVKEFAKYDYLWGKSVEAPRFVFKDVEINCSDMAFGNTMKASYNGIEIFSFTVDNKLEQLSKQGKIAKCNVIGTLGINRFLNRETPQIKADVIEIVEIKEAVRFVF